LVFSFNTIPTSDGKFNIQGCVQLIICYIVVYRIMDKTKMSAVDMTKEMIKLDPSEQHFVKKLEQMNLDRAKDMKLLRSRNKLIGAAIGAGVFGICILCTNSLKISMISCSPILA